MPDHVTTPPFSLPDSKPSGIAPVYHDGLLSAAEIENTSCHLALERTISEITPRVPIDTSLSRRRSLDLLRFIAVLMVLGRHRPLPDTGSPIIDRWGRLWCDAGWMGVDLFFVLSGFLVGGLLFIQRDREGQIRPVTFLLRRGFKIYPSFYVMIACTYVLRWLFLHESSVVSYLPELLFLQNYLGGIWNHTWSLAVEEHFYVFLALGMFWCGTRPFIALASVICICCPLLRYYICTVSSDSLAATGNYVLLLFPTHLRLDSLLVGVCAAYLVHVHPMRAKFTAHQASALLLAGIVPFIVCTYLELGSIAVMTWGLTTLALGSACIILALIAFENSICKSPILKVIAYIGSHSYSIYLWHMPFQKWCLGWDILKIGKYLSPWGAFGVYIVGSVLIGIVLAHLIERPFLMLRDRLVPSFASPTKA